MPYTRTVYYVTLETGMGRTGVMKRVCGVEQASEPWCVAPCAMIEVPRRSRATSGAWHVGSGELGAAGSHRFVATRRSALSVVVSILGVRLTLRGAQPRRPARRTIARAPRARPCG